MAFHHQSDLIVEYLETTDRWTNSPNINATTIGPSIEDYWANKVRLGLYDSLPPVMIFTGVLANMYAFIVLLRPRLRRLIVHLPLTVLAIVDSIVLLCGLLRHWLRKASYFKHHNNGLDPQIISPFACKFFEFMLYWSLTVSAWLVTLVSVERFVTICLSVDWKLRRFLTSKRGLLVVILLLFFIIIGLDAHIFWTRNLVYENTTSSSKHRANCKNEYEDFTEEIFPWLDLIFTAILPFSVITVCNCSILMKLRNVRRNSTVSASQSKIGSYRTTIMLLLTTFSFVALTFPVKTYLMIFQTPTPKMIDQHDLFLVKKYRLVWAVFLHMQFLNHCCNFWLYCASNPQFRREAQEALGILCCLQKSECYEKRNRTSSYNSSSYAAVRKRSGCSTHLAPNNQANTISDCYRETNVHSATPENAQQDAITACQSNSDIGDNTDNLHGQVPATINWVNYSADRDSTKRIISNGNETVTFTEYTKETDL